MTCEQARMEMLGETEGEEFAAHIASCEECRNEVSRICGLWQSLDLLPVEEPSSKLRDRFYEMLGAYRQGLASNPTRASRADSGASPESQSMSKSRRRSKVTNRCISI